MRKTWLSDVFGTEKVAVGVVHFLALPSDPLYDEVGGMEKVYQSALNDVRALQNGGIDALLFSNEFSFPYEKNVSKEVVAAMATLIGRLSSELKVPYGANVISDTEASIALNAAIGGCLMRGTFAGCFSGNMGLVNQEPGQHLRHRHVLGLDNKLKMIHYITPESSYEVAGRPTMSIARSAKFANLPDGFGIVGEQAGKSIDMDLMKQCRAEMPDMVLFATTGVNINTIEQIFEYADAAFIATHFKVDGIFENPVDESRVRNFMDKLKAYRSSL
jgi:uncharacterized protein